MAPAQVGMDTAMGRYFSPEEIRRLEFGLPRLSEWSACMLVPFQARQLRAASVFWINARWFLERGIDISDAANRKRVSDWLLHDFAYAIPREADPPNAFTDKLQALHADRYGSSTGKSMHGGSGRVATVRCYQAKGIGVTPLTGAGVDWGHAHGCASMEEGIREAIFAEIAAAEFPHGAVPVVAILDTGLRFGAPAGVGEPTDEVQRAIIVRPAVLRPSHAERAPLFNRSLTGYQNSQLDDVRRTREVVRHWMADSSATPALTELVKRMADQVAFGQIHRLFNGGYFSSNLSAAGALLDFGGMRALPNWANARNLDHAVGFGDEMKIVNKVIQSLAFHFNKYRPESTAAIREADLLLQAKEAHARAFNSECLRIWGLHTSADSALTAAMMQPIRRYFAQQQKLRVNYKHGLVRAQGWLYDVLADGACAAPSETSLEVQTIHEIQLILRSHFAASKHRDRRVRQAWSSAARYLMPRPALDREQLQQRINRDLAAYGTRSDASLGHFDEIVCTTVGASRRHWPRLPGDLSVAAHVSRAGSSALLCVDVASEDSILWVEGIQAQGAYHLFGSTFTSDDAQHIRAQCNGVYWTASVPLSGIDSRSGLALKLKERLIEVPSMQVRYAASTT